MLEGAALKQELRHQERMIESPLPASVTMVGAASLRCWSGRRQPGGSGGAGTRRRPRSISEELLQEAGTWTEPGLSLRGMAETLLERRLRERRQRRGAARPVQAPRLAAAHQRSGAARAAPESDDPPPERPEPKQPGGRAVPRGVGASSCETKSAPSWSACVEPSGSCAGNSTKRATPSERADSANRTQARHSGSSTRPGRGNGAGYGRRYAAAGCSNPSSDGLVPARPVRSTAT
jgi:hypothetical protein